MDAASTIYNRLVGGDQVNPGVPDNLAQLVVAQSVHETGNYTSGVYLNANNGFGYKYTGSKYQVGNYHGYGKYQDLDTSAAEMLDYIWRRVGDGSFPTDLTTITTPEQYATLLQNTVLGPYFEDSLTNYTNGITNGLETAYNAATAALQQNPYLGLVVLGGLVLLAYFITR